MVGRVQVFDLRGEPHQLARDEWTPHVKREPEDMRGVALHAWGARKVGTMGSLRARYGEALAFARRGLTVPYTIAAGVTANGGVPVVSIAHPVERYTFASDAGNAGFVSVGVMGLFAFTREEHADVRHTAMTAVLREAIDVALQEVARLLGEFTEQAGPWSLLSHRQCANGPRDHFACPGEALVSAALESSAVGVGLLVPDPDLVLDPRYGKPWPKEWRRHLRQPRQADLAFSARLQQDDQHAAERDRLPPVDGS